MNKYKKLLILSGKGGTGKTTVACAFINLAQAKAYADCDVDAPNLHLVCKQSQDSTNTDYYGLQKAHIDPEKCAGCGLCTKYCRFDAIYSKENKYFVDPFSCEGCSVCEFVCPAGAISMKDSITGEMMLYSRPSFFSTACLKMGSGNSGKLVSAVKKQLYDNLDKGCEIVVIDGSPGIGCPVIASISGVDMVLIVAEPSVSGISDMERIIDTSNRFGVLIAVCVNKYDTNIPNTLKIEKYCQNNNIPFIGKIPYDKMAVYATNRGISIVSMDCASGEAVKNIYTKTLEIINKA